MEQPISSCSRYKSVLFIILALLTSCSSSSEKDGQDAQRREQQAKAVSVSLKEITDFYGGICEYSVGGAVSNQGNSRYVKITISQSEKVDSYGDLMYLPASNIAYMAYKNSGKLKGIDKVTVLLKHVDGSNDSFEYPVDLLYVVDQEKSLLENVSGLMEEEKFNELYRLFDERVQQDLTVEAVAEYCAGAKARFGSVELFQFQGFTTLENGDGIPVLRLSGIQERSGQKVPLSIGVYLENSVPGKSLCSVEFAF